MTTLIFLTGMLLVGVAISVIIMWECEVADLKGECEVAATLENGSTYITKDRKKVTLFTTRAISTSGASPVTKARRAAL